MSSLLKNWSDVLAIVGAIIAIALSLRKAPHENRKLSAEADHIHEQAADMATARAVKLEERLVRLSDCADDLSDRIGVLEDENKALKSELEGIQASLIAVQNENTQLKEQLAAMHQENEMLRAENREFRDWAEQLVKQVKSLNAVPVKPRVKRRAK